MQGAQAGALELSDPALVNLVQRHGVQVVQLFPALPDDGDEVGRFELLQVLRHGLAGHVHVLTQGRERLAVVLVQQIQQAPATRVGQRFEDFIDVRQPG
ncbi:hypothetical protein D9M68_988120 [compost metagenome]